MRHHPGGLLPDGTLREARDSDDEDFSPLGITAFDFAELDKLEDFAKEALEIPNGFPAFVQRLKQSLVQESQVEMLMQLFGAVQKFENEALALDVLRDCSGLGALLGMDGVKYAAKWGISKEAWQQHREKMRRIFGVRKSRTLRSDQARENMRLKNYRKATIE